MSATEGKAQIRVDAVENTRLLLDQWSQSLAQVLESMTDQRPQIEWQAASGALDEVTPNSQEILWWEQPFQISPEMIVWAGAPRSAWEYAGTVTLKAAGLEKVELDEARNTWFEILGQSLSAMARSIGTLFGREVTCDAGVERAPDPDVREWARVTMKFAETEPAPLVLAISSKLATSLAAPPKAPEPAKHESAPAPRQKTEEQETDGPRSRTMDLLLDVDLPVSISFGKAQLPMKDVLKLTTGSIVELNRGVSEQVEVLVNHCLIARGEVVVVDGNYGVRIQEILSRQDRLRSVR
jgi:flagellar motor switch protein FliN/FliY